MAAILCGVLMAGCGTTAIVTTSQGPTGKPAAHHHALTVGGSTTLAGQNSGERLRATLVAYKKTIAVGEYDTPQSGMKYVGVTLRLTNVGSVPYSDSPSNGATILTATGQQGKTTIIASGECSGGFDASVKIAPGESQEGCIPFEVPDGAVSSKFQWTPASGFGEETAEWSLHG